MRRTLPAIAAAVLLLGAAPLDSAAVLAHYARAIETVASPKISIFIYAVSQAGPTDIEQRHRIYRSGTSVRDETLSIDGSKPKLAAVRIGKHEDRYAVARLAPRPAQYELLFLTTAQIGGRTAYIFDATPFVKSGAGFVVTRVAIDGETFLPRTISFKSTSLDARAEGEVAYGPAGGYWMPTLATVSATVNGSAARERIAFGEYRFPLSLPPSTFQR